MRISDYIEVRVDRRDYVDCLEVDKIERVPNYVSSIMLAIASL